MTHYLSFDPEDVTSIATGYEKTADVVNVLSAVINDATIPGRLIADDPSPTPNDIPLKACQKIHVCKTIIEACEAIIDLNLPAALNEAVHAGEVGKAFAIGGFDNVRFVLEVKDVISLKGKRSTEAVTWRKAKRLQKQLLKESSKCTRIMYDAFQDYKESHPRFVPESIINLRCLSIDRLRNDEPTNDIRPDDQITS